MRFLLVCLLTLAAARPARADDPERGIGALRAVAVTAEVAIIGGEIAPVALGTIDLIGHPRSRAYGALELFEGGLMATVNVGLLCESQDRRGRAVFGALAAIDAAVAVHGAYLVFRHAPPPALRLGAIRGRLTPAVVSDGKATTLGLGVAARF